MSAEAPVQAGGSPDFDALWAELRQWPDHYITEVHPGSVWATFDRNGQRPPEDDKPGAYRDWFPSSWCVVVGKSGFDYGVKEWFSHKWLAWAPTIREAADKLAEEMRAEREAPHRGHIRRHDFIDGCADCDSDRVLTGVGAEDMP